MSVEKKWIKSPKGREVRDLAGERFGKLVALKVDRKVKGRVYWLCRCDCGRAKTIAAYSLTSGATKSCGCASSAMRSKTRAENRARKEVTRAQLVRIDRERFDDDWMFAEQGGLLKKRLRNANGDWI